MAVHRRYDVIGIVAGIVVVFVYSSVRFEFRLRREMPLEFFNPATVPMALRETEQRVARAYWTVAVTQIQWKYGYGHALPEEPPAEFFIRRDEMGALIGDSVVRDRYWKKLRQVWGISALWERHYEWITVSVSELVQNTSRWLQEHLHRITGAS